MHTNAADVVYEEKVKVPGRSWVMVALLGALFGAFVYNQAVVTKQFNFVTLGLLALVLFSQVNHLLSFVGTKYQLTIKALNFWQGKKLIYSVPIASIDELFLGSFRELIKQDKFKNHVSNEHVIAIPKLGGHRQATLLLFDAESHKKAVFFYPSEQLRLALTNIVERLSTGHGSDN